MLWWFKSPLESDRRLWEHPILSFHRGRKVKFLFEGREVEAYEGESVAVALYAAGINVYSWSPSLHRPRGPFCMIGKCSSCFMVVNGVPNVRTCREPVKDGLVVERQAGWVPPPSPHNDSTGSQSREEELRTDVLIVGGGPAGLAAAIKLSEYGLDVTLVDEHFKLGGQLLKQTHKFFGSQELFGGLRGFQVAEKLISKLREVSNVRIFTETTAFGVFRGGVVGLASRDGVVWVKPRAVIASTGAQERYLDFINNDLPGVIGAGGVQTLMNEFGVKPGEEALVVGSGNVGVIVSYQLLQAGVKVKAVLELLPEIGGWFVHAAKLRRYGVPILTSHTIKAALGSERVEGAVITAVDERFKPVEGSEEVIKCDLILLAVGLEPDARLHAQAGAVMKWVPELGGLVPVRTEYLETSVPGMYVAGDASGIEEATTAMVEGWVAALAIASKMVDGSKAEKALNELTKYNKFLWSEYRSSPVIARARKGKESVTVTQEEMERLRATYPPPIHFR